ncbi:MAG: Ig-like domain-containing protein, partial [bacterium]
AANGTVVVNPDKTVTYTPVSWYVGTDSFTYAIADGKGGTASASVTVTMTNTAAVAVDDSAATKAGVSVIIRVLANDYDPDRDPIYVKSVTQGAKGTVTLNADNTVTYTPGTRFRGSDSFTYTIGDGRGGTDSATVTVTRLR